MYQKMIIAGNLGRDPEMRYMPDGTAVTSFNVAVNDGWGENKRTLWFRVSIWGKRAETAKSSLRPRRPRRNPPRTVGFFHTSVDRPFASCPG